MATNGLNFDDREPDVVLPQPSPQRAANLEFFRTYDAPAAHSYRLDIAALSAAATRIVPAGDVLHRRCGLTTAQKRWRTDSVERSWNSLVVITALCFIRGHSPSGCVMCLAMSREHKA